MYRPNVSWSSVRLRASDQEETQSRRGRRCPADRTAESATASSEMHYTAEAVDDGEHLARLLSDPTRLATEVLASWHQQRINAALLRRTQTSLRYDPFYAIEPITDVAASPTLVELLQSPEDAPVQHRQVRMTVPRGVVGDAYASVLLNEIAEEERHALIETDNTLGRSLQARGVRRNSLSLSYSTPADGDAGAQVVNVQAILCRGSHPLAYVQETFYPRPIPLNSNI